ncbi:MAG: DUF4834 family protein [Bacteroidota bacterium]
MFKVLLEFLLTVIFILWVIKALLRFLLPMLFQSVVNKAQDQQQQQNQQRNYQGQSQPKPDGKVKVDYIPENNKPILPDTEGEFIDYEEVK